MHGDANPPYHRALACSPASEMQRHFGRHRSTTFISIPSSTGTAQTLPSDERAYLDGRLVFSFCSKADDSCCYRRCASTFHINTLQPTSGGRYVFLHGCTKEEHYVCRGRCVSRLYIRMKNRNSRQRWDGLTTLQLKVAGCGTAVANATTSIASLRFLVNVTLNDVDLNPGLRGELQWQTSPRRYD